MDFTSHQRLFLETVCNYFHDQGKWATYGEVEKTLIDHEDFDVIEVGRELDEFVHDGIYAPLHEGAIGNEVYISLSALHTCLVEGICRPLRQDFEDFMKVVQISAKKYREAGREAKVTSQDVIEVIEPTPEMRRKVFLLVSRSGIAMGSSYSDGANGQEVYWEFGVAGQVRSCLYFGALADPYH